MMRTRNFRVWSDVVERWPVTKSKPALKEKLKSVFSGRHMDSVPKDICVVFSHMTSKPLENKGKGHTETVTVGGC